MAIPHQHACSYQTEFNIHRLETVHQRGRMDPPSISIGVVACRGMCQARLYNLLNWIASDLQSLPHYMEGMRSLLNAAHDI